ncbi:MAG TPA: DUF5908 family protein [Puia sp.]|uniref:DUF5908 family protein n=1 Tax=Puia sp. TaxID=2045100 RepID=UPI002CCC11E9|nr:DUF5908 family protein [Puia sp.]HVU99496.1 DUF5908 family protein [Puia sp.]
MPIEVRELVIKATVLSKGSSPSEGGKTDDSKTNNTVPPQEEIIKACLERVLEILKDKYER